MNYNTVCVVALDISEHEISKDKLCINPTLLWMKTVSKRDDLGVIHDIMVWLLIPSVGWYEMNGASMLVIPFNYNEVILGAIVSQITSPTIVYSTV